MTQLPAQARGRAARSNDSSRYGAQARAAFDDGWDDADAPPRQLRTTFTPEKIRSLISRNDGPDLRFDRTINPYKGCEHGCIYCFARPNYAYLDLSPGLDFETTLFFRPDAAQVLERELSNPRYVPRRVRLGASTDAYQPIERDLRIARQVMEVLERFNHPVGITTKSALVLRDADILARMARTANNAPTQKVEALIILARSRVDRAPRPCFARAMAKQPQP
jgi:hypothetical protein